LEIAWVIGSGLDINLISFDLEVVSAVVRANAEIGIPVKVFTNCDLTTCSINIRF
jgi:hypothetical protein